MYHWTLWQQMEGMVALILAMAEIRTVITEKLPIRQLN